MGPEAAEDPEDPKESNLDFFGSGALGSRTLSTKAFRFSALMPDWSLSSGFGLVDLKRGIRYVRVNFIFLKTTVLLNLDLTL